MSYEKRLVIRRSRISHIKGLISRYLNSHPAVEPKFRARLEIIRLIIMGKTATEISAELKIPLLRVYRWRDRIILKKGPPNIPKKMEDLSLLIKDEHRSGRKQNHPKNSLTIERVLQDSQPIPSIRNLSKRFNISQYMARKLIKETIGKDGCPYRWIPQNDGESYVQLVFYGLKDYITPDKKKHKRLKRSSYARRGSFPSSS